MASQPLEELVEQVALEEPEELAVVELLVSPDSQ